MFNESEFLSIRDVAKFLPGHPSVHSVRRWISRGVGTPRIRLKAVRVGTRFFVRRPDLDEFVESLQDPTNHRRRTQAERIARENGAFSWLGRSAL